MLFAMHNCARPDATHCKSCVILTGEFTPRISPGKARPAAWGDGVVGKLIAVSPADPSKGVPELATVEVTQKETPFGGAAKHSVPLKDLVRHQTIQPLKINKPGDRIGFGICRPFDGREVELAAVVNGKVVDRFQFCPPQSNDNSLSPPARLLARYTGSSGRLDAEGKRALCKHLALAAEGKVLLESELTAATCDAVAAELEGAAVSGQLSPQLRSLWTWRNIFDKYADLECGEILQDGLVLLVIDFMRLGLSSEFSCLRFFGEACC